MISHRRAFLQQLGLGTAGLALISLAPGCATPARRSGTTHLPRSTPEAEGISSTAILAFLDGMAKARHELHSLMIVRHGRVVAEGWWTPYGPEFNHTMYSMSKSFTSTAVGFAVAEKRLTVDDPVISFFPDDRPSAVGENLAALRVRDLLSMSVGNEKEPTGTVVKEENWVKAFLAQPIGFKPGTVFQYNSAATYMCSAIVQKLTGQRVVDYLRPRLFAPLGIEGMTWETCPRGINTGGWGLNIRTEGLAKFGQLYLQKGQWQGRQILPAKWVEEATSFKIQQPGPAKPTRPQEKNDWLQGYCYQFWRSQHGAYRGDGAFGQFTVVLPAQDAVIVMTGENSNLQGELDLVWEHLLPAFEPAALAANDTAARALQHRLAALSLPPPKGQPQPAVAMQVSGQRYQVAANDLGIDRLSFVFTPGGCRVNFHGAKGDHPIAAGLEQWVRGETDLPGTPPRLITGRVPGSGKFMKIASSATWRDDRTLELMLRYYETPHHDVITCSFAGDTVKLSFLSSILKLRSAKDARPVLEGKRVA
jgi:CubicO group peptidase (beta-lactamase class C family)